MTDGFLVPYQASSKYLKGKVYFTISPFAMKMIENRETHNYAGNDEVLAFYNDDIVLGQPYISGLSSVFDRVKRSILPDGGMAPGRWFFFRRARACGSHSVIESIERSNSRIE